MLSVPLQVVRLRRAGHITAAAASASSAPRPQRHQWPHALLLEAARQEQVRVHAALQRAAAATLRQAAATTAATG